MQIFSNKKVFLLSLLVISLVGVGIMLYCTPYGIGLVNDSVGYIDGARNILAGNGYSRLKGDWGTVPYTNYSPFFPFCLAVLGFLGIETILAAEILNIFLFALNTFLTGLLTGRIVKAKGFALLAALLFAVSTPFINTHVFAMTEPVYLTLSMLVLLFLVIYIEKNGQIDAPKAWVWLVLSGFTAGLAYLARYVGASLFATAILTLLVFGSDWKKRLQRSGLFLLSGMPLLVGWMLRNMLVAESAANRQLLWHPIPLYKIKEGILNFWGWLLPETFGFIEKLWVFWGLVFVLLLAGLVFVLLQSFLKRRREKTNLQGRVSPLIWVLALQALVYFGLLVVTLTILDASPIFEDRILAPFSICLIPLLFYGFDWLWQNKSLFFRGLVIFSLLFLGVSLLEDTLDILKDYHADGLGFRNSYWRESQTIAALQDAPHEIIFYSNRITATYILTGHPSFILPSPINPATGGPREGYEEDLSMIRQKVLNGEGLMIIFGYDDLLISKEDSIWVQELSSGLPLWKDLEDGMIFGYGYQVP